MRAAASRAPTASGNYYNSRTGTSGSYAGGRQYNAWTGNATRGYDRTVNGAAGGSGNVARASNYNVYSGQRSTANAVSARGPAEAPTIAPGRRRRVRKATPTVGGGSTYNAKDRPDQHVGHGESRQQPLRRRQRERLQELPATAGSSIRRADGTMHPRQLVGQS
jgi:hypothetical protein